MKSELRVVWSYVRAVFREWWFIVAEVVLTLTDVLERIFGTWLLPSTGKKIAIGIAVLVLAQYRAYRRLWLELQSERARKTRLAIIPNAGSTLYIERPGNAARSIGFYLELRLGVQNDGDENSVIRNFRLEVEEIQKVFGNIVPHRRNAVQTRTAQHMLQQNWISQEPDWIIVRAHDVSAGILPFYVAGEVPDLPPQVHCRLTLEDTAGASIDCRFEVRVQD